MGQPFVPCYMVLDDEGRALYPLGQTMFNDGAYENYEWSQDNLKEVQNGLLRKADSIEELSEMIGCPVEELLATVETWNESCEKGVDELGRPPKSMVAVRKPPFYLAEIWPVVSNTQGGPVHDEKRRVVNAYGEPIPRLYTAGELGGIWGSLYLSGGNLTECFVSGRIAGRTVAAEDSRPE
jgi:succinate dehydrogenase/fumarate reductase flavoprotein subunit